MRDYSEKRGARESVERKQPIAKNRPRKESGGKALLLTVLGILCTYGAGVLTGWVVFKGPRKAAPLAVSQAAKKEEATPAPPQPKPDAPLSFYKTLPAGGKGTMGTGLNLKKPEPAPSAPRQLPIVAPVAAPAAEPAEATAAALAAAPAAANSPVAAPTAAGKPETSVRYVVQVASYREKQEAATAQAKLSVKGVAAYLVESKLGDKGVWYRLRVGHHLTRAEAGEIAGKAGKGAIVLPE